MQPNDICNKIDCSYLRKQHNVKMNTMLRQEPTHEFIETDLVNEARSIIADMLLYLKSNQSAETRLRAQKWLDKFN